MPVLRLCGFLRARCQRRECTGLRNRRQRLLSLRGDPSGATVLARRRPYPPRSWWRPHRAAWALAVRRTSGSLPIPLPVGLAIVNKLGLYAVTITAGADGRRSRDRTHGSDRPD